MQRVLTSNNISLFPTVETKTCQQGLFTIFGLREVSLLAFLFCFVLFVVVVFVVAFCSSLKHLWENESKTTSLPPPPPPKKKQQKPPPRATINQNKNKPKQKQKYKYGNKTTIPPLPPPPSKIKKSKQTKTVYWPSATKQTTQWLRAAGKWSALLR